MIKLNVEVEDADNSFEVKELTLPCNLRSELQRGRDYLIVGCTPHISEVMTMDIWELNSMLDEINCENPAMTAEFFAVLVEASEVYSLPEENFIRRVKENDFIFEDVSELGWKGMYDEEKAARFIVEKFKAPFDTNITKKHLEILCDDTLTDYIAWEFIWNQYQLMGFKLVKDPVSDRLYLVHWA